jgi:hypothetical protein
VNDEVPRRIGEWFTLESIANRLSYTTQIDHNFRGAEYPSGIAFCGSYVAVFQAVSHLCAMTLLGTL